MFTTKNILLTIGLASFAGVVILKLSKKDGFKNFVPYTSRQICMKGSAAGENRGEFMGGRCI